MIFFKNTLLLTYGADPVFSVVKSEIGDDYAIEYSDGYNVFIKSEEYRVNK